MTDILELLDKGRKIIITPTIFTEEEVRLYLKAVHDEIERIEQLPTIYVLQEDEAKLLLDYLNKGVGYINPEWWDGINILHRKLNESINGKEGFTPCKKKELT
jgi:hypothetical protein